MNQERETGTIRKELLFFFAVGFVLYAALILLWVLSPSSNAKLSSSAPKAVAEQTAIGRLAFLIGANDFVHGSRYSPK